MARGRPKGKSGKLSKLPLLETKSQRRKVYSDEGTAYKYIDEGKQMDGYTLKVLENIERNTADIKQILAVYVDGTIKAGIIKSPEETKEDKKLE